MTSVLQPLNSGDSRWSTAFIAAAFFSSWEMLKKKEAAKMRKENFLLSSLLPCHSPTHSKNYWWVNCGTVNSRTAKKGVKGTKMFHFISSFRCRWSSKKPTTEILLHICRSSCSREKDEMMMKTNMHGKEEMKKTTNMSHVLAHLLEFLWNLNHIFCT